MEVNSISRFSSVIKTTRQNILFLVNSALYRAQELCSLCLLEQILTALISKNVQRNLTGMRRPIP